MESIETFDFLFCLLDVCGQSFIRGNGKTPYWKLLSNGRSSLDYARNVAKNFDDPEPNDPSSNSELISSRRLFQFPSGADSKRSSHDEEETRHTQCSCCCRILRSPPCFSTRSRNHRFSQPNFHQFFSSLLYKWYRNEVATNHKEVLKK